MQIAEDGEPCCAPDLLQNIGCLAVHKSTGVRTNIDMPDASYAT